MSFFSFGSSKHSTFHARITIHELDNIPLLEGSFHVKWKVGNSQHLPSSLIAGALEREREKEKERSKDKDKEKDNDKEKEKDGQQQQRRAHRHGNGHSTDNGHQKLYQSQQITQADLPLDLFSLSGKSRKERQFASDPGNANVNANGDATQNTNTSPDAAPGTEAETGAEDPDTDRTEDTEAEERRLGARRLFGAGATATAAVAPVSNGGATPVGNGKQHGEDDDKQPEEHDSLVVDDDDDGDVADAGQQLHVPEQDQGQVRWRSTTSSSATTSPSNRSISSTTPSTSASPSAPASRTGRFARFLHGLSPTATSFPITGKGSASSLRASSGASQLSFASSADGDGVGVGVTSGNSSSSSSYGYGHGHGRGVAVTHLHPHQQTYAHPHQGHSHSHSHSRARARSLSQNSSSETSNGEPKSSGVREREQEQERDGERGSADRDGGSSQERKSSHIEEPLTPGLDLTRERPSLNSKHSSSRLSTTSSGSRKDKGKGKSHVREHHRQHHADKNSHPSSPHINGNGTGSANANTNANGGSGTPSPSPAMGNGSSRTAATVAAGEANAAASVLQPQLESKGNTETINVKDHTVKWERTFEVGVRVPVEKYKQPKDESTSSSSHSLTALGRVTAEGGGSGTGRDAGGADRPPDVGGSGGLRNQRSRGSLRKSYETQEWERERELAEAWGILGKATLRLSVKQVGLDDI